MLLLLYISPLPSQCWLQVTCSHYQSILRSNVFGRVQTVAMLCADKISPVSHRSHRLHKSYRVRIGQRLSRVDDQNLKRNASGNSDVWVGFRYVPKNIWGFYHLYPPAPLPSLLNPFSPPMTSWVRYCILIYLWGLLTLEKIRISISKQMQLTKATVRQDKNNECFSRIQYLRYKSSSSMIRDKTILSETIK